MIKIIRSSTIPKSLATFCAGVLSELSKRYEVIGLSSPGEDLEIIAKQEGIRTIAVPMKRQISLFNDLVSLMRLIRVFREEKPRMVHSMTPKAGLLCMVAAWLTKVPVRVHTFTGLVFPTSKGLKRRILMATDKLTCACATHVIPEGEGVKEDLIKNKITQKPLHVLGYGNVRGVNMDYYDRTPEVEEKAKVLRDPSLISFLFVGRIVRDKGINELINAFKMVKQSHSEIRLFLVGEYENNLDPIDREVYETITTSKDIIAVGRKNGTDLLAYYAASDCFVFPSYREGFPNTVLEAGALQLPCIVTNINGSREIIKDGFNGLIVPPRDARALCDAMVRIIENPAERKSMASEARQHIASHFEQGFVRQCLYDFYEKVL